MPALQVTTDMRTFRMAALILLMTACTLRPSGISDTGASAAATYASAGTSAQPSDGPNQVARPLRLARRAAPSIADIEAVRNESQLPAALIGAKLVASSGRTLYFAPASGLDTIYAVDAFDGTVRWHRENMKAVGASESLAFVAIEPTATMPGSVLELSARDGHQELTYPGYWAGSVLHGYFYATHGSQSGPTTFAAYDGKGGRKLWSVPGTANVGGPPTLIGKTLLQSFSESGAILVNAMHAFDVTTGRELWRRGYGPLPLGTASRAVYLDTTWFPMQLDTFSPLCVGSVDLATGALLHEYCYHPDRARNWPRGDRATVSAENTHVGAGFVTFELNGSWYRYDADRDPDHARASRLDGIGDIANWLDGRHALVVSGDSVSLATWLPDRIDLQPLGSGTLRAPVAVSDSGTRYAVIGSRLLSLDEAGRRIRAIGSVSCATVVDVIALLASVAVRCGSEHAGSLETLMSFRTSTAPLVDAYVHPLPAAVPRFALAITSKPLPPAGTEPFDRQWWPSSIAPGPEGSLALVLIATSMNRPSGIGRVSADGDVRLVRLSEVERGAHPQDAVVDAHGTIWFNDDRLPTITSLARDGSIRNVPMAAASDSPTPESSNVSSRAIQRRFSKRGRLGVRLAIGPDGEAWFARSHPANIIGRVDGTRTFAVPTRFGDVLALVGGHDGAVWFLSADSIGRVGFDGTFTRVPLPEDFADHGYPKRRLIAGLTKTVWVAAGGKLAEVDARNVLRTWSLPNASSGIAGLTIGCDGTVYAADTLAAQVARFAPDGTVEEHETGLSSLDGLATSSDCRLWFVGGANAPTQKVGIFSFEPSLRP